MVPKEQEWHEIKTEGSKNIVLSSQVNEFKTVNSAFRELDFSSEAVDSIWKLVAVILHLGNLKFSSGGDEAGDHAILEGAEKKQAARIAEMLGVRREDLEASLLSRVIAASGEVMHHAHTLSEAVTSRDSFAKALYDRLFTWIVGHVNAAIDPELTNRDGHHHVGSTVIGVLDIYGFEVFNNNSFEQFCINYCNEKLQQLFIELVLKQQQEEYKREGIEWVHVEYFNNKIICELIDQPHQGIMALMDEACLTVGKTTDKQLLEAMDTRLKQNPHYSSRALGNKQKNGGRASSSAAASPSSSSSLVVAPQQMELHQDFLIRHYAGDVVYSVQGFIDKNRDTLFQDFKRLLYESDNAIYKSMWPEGAHDITRTTKRPATAGSVFKNSMSALMKLLAVKEPFYVRCIKPNEIKSAVSVNDERVVHQISYLGLLENVRVRRAGFAFRQDYTKFLLRYKMIARATWPNYYKGGGGDKEAVRALLQEKKLANDATLGKTKVFIRSPETIFQLEEIRESVIPRVVTTLQKMVRGVLARRRVAKLRAALKIGLYYRHYVLRTYVEQLHRAFRHVKRSPDLGKSVAWPEPPKTLAHVSPMLKKAYLRWRSFRVLSKYPKHSWPEMRLKITALEILKGKRSQWGIHRQWRGDYMNISTENLDVDLYRSALAKEGVTMNRVAFSARNMKFNRHGKVNERVLVVTQNKLFKLDPCKKFKMMESVSLSEVESVSLSPDDGNQLVVIHLREHNDLILSLVSSKNEDLVGELVAVLATHYARLTSRELPVVAANVLRFHSGKKTQSITINARQVMGGGEDSAAAAAANGGGGQNNNHNYQSQFIKSQGGNGGIVYTAFTSANNTKR